ncbi:MAG: penicillin-binding protein 1C [Saprospiraceae bacterium]|nr:penicillin-binding protein 1C [Saprospiraceae bacterium]MBP7699753.1 penicillin-binding protein 1C [Saprospiraceae bacterium]
MAVIVGLWYLYCLPSPLFQAPLSKVLEDAEGNLLGAKIATDGQWRFPAPDSLPEKYVKAVTAFEDKRFWYHWGFDPFRFARAIQQNMRAKKIISGGSTITMQVVRLARNNPARSVWQKLMEIIMATRLEFSYSKKSILKLYAANAPFGGNVVGIEAAAWRYFGKKITMLTWAEAATLAVLPNSPSLINPSKNRTALRDKRNKLLDKLFKQKYIDSTTLILAKDEPLPDKPLPLPKLAPHLLDFAIKQFFTDNHQSRLRSTIQRQLQMRITEILTQHHQILSANNINNIAALVMEVETGKVVAYVGNVPDVGAFHAESVDIIQAPRSTGSTLKPLLYAMMLQDGMILPQTQIPDIPTQVFGYEPENFLATYDGVITARQALTRSLNIPFVRMLQQYGVQKFLFNLQKLGFKQLRHQPEHYGLSLILGGGETTLWELTNTYACLARMLSHFYTNDGRYDKNDFRLPQIDDFKKTPKTARLNLLKHPPYFNAGAVWFTFDAMKDLERPTDEGNWELFQNEMSVAWKTGTSFGFRDAWAVGITPRYAVGVWAGNADGEGRPGLTGIQVAAPILFDIFRQLPSVARWFDAPFDEQLRIPVCSKSGFRPLSICEVDTVWGLKESIKVGGCPYHQIVHLDSTEQYQVTSTCVAPSDMVHKTWFVLPPLEEYYYQPNHPTYSVLPPFRKDCNNTTTQSPMQLIYPQYAAKIYVPLELDGSIGKTIFKVAHRHPEKTIYWHWDNQYLGSTKNFHHWALTPPFGTHQLTLVDEDGNRLEKMIEILRKE